MKESNVRNVWSPHPLLMTITNRCHLRDHATYYMRSLLYTYVFGSRLSLWFLRSKRFPDLVVCLQLHPNSSSKVRAIFPLPSRTYIPPLIKTLPTGLNLPTKAPKKNSHGLVVCAIYVRAATRGFRPTSRIGGISGIGTLFGDF